MKCISSRFYSGSVDDIKVGDATLEIEVSPLGPYAYDSTDALRFDPQVRCRSQLWGIVRNRYE